MVFLSVENVCNILCCSYLNGAKDWFLQYHGRKVSGYSWLKWLLVYNFLSFFLLLLDPPQFVTTRLPEENIPAEKQRAGAVRTCLRCKVQQFFFKVMMKAGLCWDSRLCWDTCRCSTQPAQLLQRQDRRDSWRGSALKNLSAICQAVSSLNPELKEWANCFAQGMNALRATGYLCDEWSKHVTSPISKHSNSVGKFWFIEFRALSSQYLQV